VSKASQTLNSSKNQNWRTDKRELDLVRLLGPILFDPMTDSDNPTGARWFIDPRGCGNVGVDDVFMLPEGVFAQAQGLIFVNPTWGYSLAKVATLLCREGTHVANPKYGLNEMVVLAPHRLDTKWCRQLQRSADKVCVLPYRPYFLERKENGSWGRAQAKDRKGKLRDTAVTVTCAFYYWGYRSSDVQAMWAQAVPEATFIKVDR